MVGVCLHELMSVCVYYSGKTELPIEFLKLSSIKGFIPADIHQYFDTAIEFQQ